MQLWMYRCGHTGMQSPWGTGSKPHPDICQDCRVARIGEVITFIRHGAPPKSGHSKNHQDSSLEQGVSVYEIVNGQPQYTGWWYQIADRPAYEGTGRIVGWGADGEPVVQIETIRKQRSRKQSNK